MQNMYKLVISEKPSVGKSIAAVLGANERKDGYFMGNGYIVSWCFGHLAELAEAAAYDEKYAKWRYDDLPILPESWQYWVVCGQTANTSLEQATAQKSTCGRAASMRRSSKCGSFMTRFLKNRNG